MVCYNGEKLVSFLTEVDLVACNGRTFVMEPEWTRIRPGPKQKSIIDYIITDMQMLKKSGNCVSIQQTLEFPITSCFGWK